MTPEQKQVIQKCKDMMKVAFPTKTGYLKFNFDKHNKFVDVHEYWKVENQ